MVQRVVLVATGSDGAYVRSDEETVIHGRVNATDSDGACVRSDRKPRVTCDLFAGYSAYHIYHITVEKPMGQGGSSCPVGMDVQTAPIPPTLKATVAHCSNQHSTCAMVMSVAPGSIASEAGITKNDVVCRIVPSEDEQPPCVIPHATGPHCIEYIKLLKEKIVFSFFIARCRNVAASAGGRQTRRRHSTDRVDKMSHVSLSRKSSKTLSSLDLIARPARPPGTVALNVVTEPDVSGSTRMPPDPPRWRRESRGRTLTVGSGNATLTGIDSAQHLDVTSAVQAASFPNGVISSPSAVDVVIAKVPCSPAKVAYTNSLESHVAAFRRAKSAQTKHIVVQQVVDQVYQTRGRFLQPRLDGVGFRALSTSEACRFVTMGLADTTRRHIRAPNVYATARIMIGTPGDNDVIVGRYHSNHPGNATYQANIASFLDSYGHMKCGKKQYVAQHVVDEVGKWGGRFVRPRREGGFQVLSKIEAFSVTYRAVENKL